jgi:hypothetical protein
MQKKAEADKKRTGIFIYCSESEKKRLKRMARVTGRTLSGYVMYAAMARLRRDEWLKQQP